MDRSNQPHDDGASLDGLAVSLPEHVLSQELGGEIVLLDLESQSYYGLNRLGTRVWSLLREGKQPGEICRTLLQECQVEEGALREDVAAFLSRLAQEGIIRVDRDGGDSA